MGKARKTRNAGGKRSAGNHENEAIINPGIFPGF
jgi:hypothetical protein